MAYVSLSDLQIKDYFHGITAIIIIIISIIIGIRIFLTYYKYREKTYITVGLTYFFLLSPYWGGAISFIGVLTVNYALDAPIYIFLSSAFLPIALVSWIYSVATLLYEQYKRLLVFSYLTSSLIFEVFLIIFLFTDYTIVGELSTKINMISNVFLMIFQIFTIASLVVTGIHFSILSIESENPRTNLKGRFLFSSWLFILFSALLDAILTELRKKSPPFQGGDEFRTGYTHFCCSFEIRETLTPLRMGGINRRVSITNFGASLLLNTWVPL